MKAKEFITEKWTKKYKSSINCSHPKGFSQKAHCAGKNKHNESIEMEMVCEDCGMCKTHGSLNEIKKGAKDSNGFTKCWPGKHADGTKKGKNGGQVRNCVPNESIEESKKRCQQCGMTNCSCKPGTCKCKPVAGWIPNKGFKKAVEEGMFDSKPKVDWNKRAKELFAKGLNEQQVAQQLIKEGCLPKQVNVYVQAGQLQEDWNKVNKRDKTDGLSQKAVNAYRRENPGSKLKTAVTTKPSKLKPGSKAAKRRKSFCARMGGNKGPMKKPNGKPTPKALALRRWNCESIEQMAQMIEQGEQMISEMKQRLDPKCWTGKHKEGTKIKGGVRVNNCVPNKK